VSGDSFDAQPEATTLDRLHAAMILQASGRTNALRTFLNEETDGILIFYGWPMHCLLYTREGVKKNGCWMQCYWRSGNRYERGLQRPCCLANCRGTVFTLLCRCFLRYGVALIGPGDSGRWTPERGDEEFEGRFVRQFANEVKNGDVFLLRTGISTICAIGIVASEYMYFNQFDDVNGWDIQHGRRVCWYKLPQEYEVSNGVFGSSPSRFSKVHSDEMIDFTRRFVNSPPYEWQNAPLPVLPEEEPL
jgi:hypothetical protein